MIDIEVIRLRQLRNTALRARAIGLALNARSSDTDSLFAQSALACWRVARLITGKLRAHPYQSYQREAGALRSWYDRMLAALIGAAARVRGGSFGCFSPHLQRVARELDDARALTWSPTLSDAFGRSQSEFRGLLAQLSTAVRAEGTARAKGVAREEAALRSDAAVRRDASVRLEVAGNRGSPSQAAAHWPYLAF
ncbi:MAG: hypothetical protein WBF21_12845 [Steroidobacteraceae bacterium]